jgi:hypothetical protein
MLSSARLLPARIIRQHIRIVSSTMAAVSSTSASHPALSQPVNKVHSGVSSTPAANRYLAVPGRAVTNVL